MNPGKSTLHIGTCSWKYKSWQGLVYTSSKPDNYLKEYAEKFNSVEVDQWFWSLFGENKVVLPQSEVVKEYASSVPADFRFTVKVPNSITLTHFYNKKKNDPLIPNPHFLSSDLYHRFLDSLEPLLSQIGAFNFQFEYLNRQKMDSLARYLEQLNSFWDSIGAIF